MVLLPKSKSAIVNSRGDTIVEVLIAISVISIILVGGFTTVNSSRIALRDSQEHAEAMLLLNGQIEAIRPLATDATSKIYASSIFCVDSSDTVQTGFGYSAVPPLQNDNWTNYPSACSNVNNLYNISISYDSTTQVFTFQVRWDRLSGSRDQVVLFYRLSPGNVSPALPTYASCSDPGIISETYYYNFYSYPSAGSTDWHVFYIDKSGNPAHTISATPYPSSGSIIITPGQYTYWAFAKDTKSNPTAKNRRLHYQFVDLDTDTILAVTGDTPDMGPTSLISAPATGTITIPAGVKAIKVEHGTFDPSSIDDGVDGACLALRSLP